MDNFTKDNPKGVKEYLISVEAIEQILSNTSCAGISLHYATDPNGALHILPIGVDSNGKMMITQNIATPSGVVEWQTAQQWINNYTGYIRSHFFGTLTFSRLLAQQPTQLRATLALNDVGAPQLLLTNASAITPAGYEDASQPCPPYCPSL
jgi:hypothetical protein